MARCSLAALALWTCGLAFAQSNVNPDFYYGSVIEAFRKHDPQMVHFSLLYKGQASEELDVILVRGGSPRLTWRDAPSISELREGDLLGVFLVSSSDPALAYQLTIESDLANAVKVERDVPGEITIRTFSDYGHAGIRRKYFYQASNKQLIAKQDFWPMGLEHAHSSNGQVILWGGFSDLSGSEPTGPTLAVAPEGDGFREVDPPLDIRSVHFGAVELLAFGDGCKLIDTREDPIPRLISCETESGGVDKFQVPLAEFANFASLRPIKVSRGWTQAGATFNETIGPYQLIGQDLWFGITFYDGEGHTGIGGFGMFNSTTRQFELRYPQEMAEWSVSALLVEDDAVWMALEERTEGQARPGGLVRWDRATHEIQRWPGVPRSLGIARKGERLYMATDEGAAIFENGEVVRYLLDVDGSGTYSLVRRERR